MAAQDRKLIKDGGGAPAAAPGFSARAPVSKAPKAAKGGGGAPAATPGLPAHEPVPNAMGPTVDGGDTPVTPKPSAREPTKSETVRQIKDRGVPATPVVSVRKPIKSKTVKATLANKDVLDMFQSVIGTSNGGAALWITHPKYGRIFHHVGRFIKLLELFHDSSALRLFPNAVEHLGLYVGALKAQAAESFCAPDLARYMPPDAVVGMAEDYEAIPPEVSAAFSTCFGAVKTCNLVNLIVVTCTNLIVHKKSLGVQGALKDRFLVRDTGLTFCPLPDLPQVNFKQIYIDDRLSVKDKEYVLMILHKLFTIGHDVYEAVSAPDVDVDEFTDVIMTSIGDVRKHIPRCDQAFDKIEESVGLLKGNFGGYYKDYIASNNPTIIMENFVLDVSKSTKSSPRIAAQFQQIIRHYRKIVSQKSSNPKLHSLFQQVDANFQELESKGRTAEDDDSDSDDEKTPAGEPSHPAEADREHVALQQPVAAPAPVAAPTRPSRRARRRHARKAQTKPQVGPNPEEGLVAELDRDVDRAPSLAESAAAVDGGGGVAAADDRGDSAAVDGRGGAAAVDGGAGGAAAVDGGAGGVAAVDDATSTAVLPERNGTESGE